MFSNKYSPIILISLLLVGLFCIFYINFLLPRKAEADNLVSMVASIQQEVSELQQHTNSLQTEYEETLNDIVVEDKRLPWDKDFVELLMNIEEIQLVSDLNIKNIQFSYNEALVNDTESLNPNALNPNEMKTTTEGEATEEAYTLEGLMDDDTAVTEYTASATDNSSSKKGSSEVDFIFDNVRLIGFSIDVETVDEAHLLTFIEEMEGLDRFIRVNSISYSLPGEQSEGNSNEDMISANIQASAFYFNE